MQDTPDIPVKKKLLYAAAALLFVAGLMGLWISWRMFSYGQTVSFTHSGAKLYGVLTVMPAFPLLAGWRIWSLVRRDDAGAPEYKGLLKRAVLVLGVAACVLVLFIIMTIKLLYNLGTPV